MTYAAQTLDDDRDAALARIASGATERDRHPAPPFPEDAVAALEDAGLLAWNAGGGPRRPPGADELALVRAVAHADASVGRIFDGHLNAVERLIVQGPEALRERELALVRAHRLRAGVWGGDPRPGEGPRAAVRPGGDHEVLRGVKTFCSGAGGLDRALVLAVGEASGPPVSVWIDLTDPDRVEVDESWYRSSGLRASASHRVVFHDAPVLGRLGDAGAIAVQPWFGRDALRTAASWAGMVDSALAAALAELAGRPDRSPLEDRAAGQMLAAAATLDVWLAAAATAMDAGVAPAATDADRAGIAKPALYARVAIAESARTILETAGQACGSHAFATGDDLDRARRDLELFLLQHRLDPMLTRTGASVLSGRRS